jgi:hypothetical protein
MSKVNSIVERFSKSQDRLVLQSSDLSLDAIARMVESKVIDVSPLYQRRDRWSDDKQSALIESFLLNIPVPPIYLAEDEYGSYSAIDGKQRVTAINKFILHKMKLQNLEYFKEVENMTFDELPKDLKNALTIRPYLRVVTLLKQSDPNLKYEVFTRLNTGGDPLLAQEIRNVVFRGSLNNLIYDLGKNDFLKHQLKITSESSKPYKEMLDAEYVLRFFTLRAYWKHFPGNMRKAMDYYMMENSQLPPSKITALKKLFNTAIECAEKIWGDKAFIRPDGNRQIVQGFYDIQMVPLSLLNEKNTELLVKNKEKLKKLFLKKYNDDPIFNEAIRQFTSNPKNVQYRMETMNSLILDAINN